ncbi:MAG: DUF29 domain-containing protein [Candidatus Entotheonellia bacterium]
MTKAAYDTDFYAWTQAQAAALRAGAWGDVDRDHLAEEIADLGTSQRHAVTSHLRVLLLHLLKWHYQPERRSESWLHSMANAQVEIETYLDESPSLRPELPAFVARAYQQAYRLAVRETGLPTVTFPFACPWTIAQLLDPDFLPAKLG